MREAALDPNGEFVDAMTVGESGEVYVGGRSGADEGEGFVGKYFPGGAMAWTRDLGRPASAIPLSMVLDLVVDASQV
jgi:hypothetical protein